MYDSRIDDTQPDRFQLVSLTYAPLFQQLVDRIGEYPDKCIARGSFLINYLKSEALEFARLPLGDLCNFQSDNIKDSFNLLTNLLRNHNWVVMMVNMKDYFELLDAMVGNYDYNSIPQHFIQNLSANDYNMLKSNLRSGLLHTFFAIIEKDFGNRYLQFSKSKLIDPNKLNEYHEITQGSLQDFKNLCISKLADGAKD